MEYKENIEEEQKQIKEIWGDMLKYAPSKICGTLGNAIIVPVYTSLLPPEQYGLYTLSIAFLSFLCIIFSDWVGLSGLRFFRLAQINNGLNKYLSILITILSVNLILMYILSFLLKDFFYSFFKITPIYLLAILVLIIPVAIRALLFQILRAQLKPVAFTFSTILNQILTIGLSVFIIKTFHLGAFSLLLAMGISITFIDILLIFQSNIISYLKFTKPEMKYILPIAKYGVPIALTSLSTWVINQSNKFIINDIKGFKELGYVGVAYGVTLPLLMTIFSIITVAAIPRIIRMYEEKIDVKNIVSKITGYYILISLPVIFIMSIYAKEFVGLLADSRFLDAYKLVPYFAFGTFFMGLTDYTTLQYHLSNKTYIDFIIKIISGVIGICLNIFLIPEMGLIGLGIATLGANFIYYFLSAIIVLPNLSLKYPVKQLINMFFGFFILYGVYLIIHKAEIISAPIQMVLLLFVFYFIYFLFEGRFKNKKLIQ